MNIAFFSEMARIEGSAFHMLRQARWMIAHGHGAIMISSGGPLEEEFARHGIAHITTPSTLQNAKLDAEQLIADGAAVERACHEYAIDAILAAPSLPFSLASAAVGSHVPVYLNILSSRYFVPTTARSIDAVRRAATEGRIISTTIDDVIPHGEKFGFDPTLARLAPVPIDLTHGEPTKSRADVRAEIGVGDDEIVIFTACRLDDDRVDFILPLAGAVMKMRAKGLPARLVVAGTGNAADRLRLQAPQGTVFVGVRRDLANFLHASDIFCGEGSIIADAALAKLPVILSCALVLPHQADRAFSIFGLLSLDHLYWTSTALVPPTDFLAALEPIVADAALRERLANAAYETATTYFSIDRYMPWLLSIVGGENPPSLLPLEDAAFALQTAGGMDDGLDRAGNVLAQIGDEQRIGLDLETPVPWIRTLAMPTETARTLVRASRRRVTPQTPRVRVMHDGTVDGSAIELPLRERVESLARELPATSTVPPFAFGTPCKRLVLIVVGPNADPGEIYPCDTLGEADGLVLWIPHPGPESAQRVDGVRQQTRAQFYAIGEPVVWTLVGRLIAAATTYADDGSPALAPYRDLARQLGVDVHSKERP